MVDGFDQRFEYRGAADLTENPNRPVRDRAGPGKCGHGGRGVFAEPTAGSPRHDRRPRPGRPRAPRGACPRLDRAHRRRLLTGQRLHTSSTSVSHSPSCPVPYISERARVGALPDSSSWAIAASASVRDAPSGGSQATASASGIASPQWQRARIAADRTRSERWRSARIGCRHCLGATDLGETRNGGLADLCVGVAGGFDQASSVAAMRQVFDFACSARGEPHRPVDRTPAERRSFRCR